MRPCEAFFIEVYIDPVEYEHHLPDTNKTAIERFVQLARVLEPHGSPGWGYYHIQLEDQNLDFDARDPHEDANAKRVWKNHKLTHDEELAVLTEMAEIWNNSNIQDRALIYIKANRQNTEDTAETVREWAKSEGMQRMRIGAPGGD